MSKGFAAGLNLVSLAGRVGCVRHDKNLLINFRPRLPF
jgi:hypothetical protein